MRRRHTLSLATLLLPAAFACGDSAGPDGPAPVASITVSPGLDSVFVGGQIIFSAILVDGNGNTLTGRQIAWTSSVTAIATVVGGAVTGESVGTSTITATSEGISGSGDVVVQPVPVADVQLSLDSLTLVLRATAQLGVQTFDSLGRELTGRDVTWSSSNASVASVDASGIVTGTAPGVVTITATSEGVSATSEATVVMLRFTSVSVGGHSCGVTPGGAAWCWGEGTKGELGHGRTDTTGIPVRVLGGLTSQSVASGGWHTCAVTSTGVANCWGVENRLGIGLSDTTSYFLPVPVAGSMAFQSIAASSDHTCGLEPNGSAHCWGGNFAGRLGVGVSDDTTWTTPAAVVGGLSFTALSLGTDAGPTCGLLAGGDIYCWGSQNDVGQIGIGSFDFNTHAAPELVSGGIAFQSVSAGGAHACGLDTSGAAYCWGGNFTGQLGAATTETCSFGTCSTAPVAVSGGITFQSIAAGSQYTCGVATDGQAYCWGDVVPLTGSGNPTPVAVGSGITFASLSAGASHICGVSTSNMAYCWGHNWNGSVGNGSLTGSVASPTLVFGQQ